MKTKTICSIILTFLFSVSEKLDAQAPSWEWAKAIGSLNSEWAWNSAIDKSGSVYSIGIFNGTTDFDPGPGIYNLYNGYIFISKLDKDGNFVWAKSLSGVESFTISVDDSGDVYTAGYFFGTKDFDPDSLGVFNLTSAGGQDVFVLKLDSSGNFVWAKSFGGAAFDISKAVANDASGNVYIIGQFGDTVDFDPDSSGVFNLTATGYDDIFILKLNSSGDFVWAKALAGTSFAEGESIAVDTLGNVYSTGYFQGIVDFDPDSLGVFNLTGSGLNDAFISKLDNAGNFAWAKQIGGTNQDEGCTIAVDGLGNVLTTGFFHQTVDFDPGPGIFNLTVSIGTNGLFISKLDNSGNFLWAKSIITPFQLYSSIGVDATNNIYLTSIFGGTIDVDPDTSSSYYLSSSGGGVFICKLKSSGNFVWGKSFGDTCDVTDHYLAVDPFGSVYVAGSFESPKLIIGLDTLYNVSNLCDVPNIFIVKLGTINTGIETIIHSNSISIYPNPVNNVLNISLNNNLPASSLITINDMQGRVIKEENISQSNSTMQVDVSALSQGVYLLRINGQVQRFVKM